jgi:hypothetical protein
VLDGQEAYNVVIKYFMPSQQFIVNMDPISEWRHHVKVGYIAYILETLTISIFTVKQLPLILVEQSFSVLHISSEYR